MENEEIIKQRIKYYYDEYNLYCMLEFIKKRELAILDYEKPLFFRGGFCTGVFNLSKFIKYFDISTSITSNLYISSAKFSSFPIIKNKPNDIKRSDYFFNYVKDKIIHYDLLIDFDVKNENERDLVFTEFTRFCGEMLKRNISFFALNSGNGFHCVLNKLNFPFELDGETLILYENYGKRLKEDFKLKYYDLKNIGVWNRLQKLPLSMVKDKICNLYTFNLNEV